MKRHIQKPKADGEKPNPLGRIVERDVFSQPGIEITELLIEPKLLFALRARRAPGAPLTAAPTEGEEGATVPPITTRATTAPASKVEMDTSAPTSKSAIGFFAF